MEKGSGTRSSLLWEVERILSEIKDGNGELPNVLLMENIPEVIGTKNIKHFAKWVEFLDDLGYKSHWKCLNAKDYGIPQNRNRCFMVSILGDYYYDMPKNKKLTSEINDYLENEVSHKYYLTLEQLIYAFDCKRVCDNTKRGDLGDRITNPKIAKTISCRGAESQRADITNFIVGENKKEYTLGEIRDIILKSIKNSHLKATLEKTNLGDKILSIDSYNKVAYEDCVQTIRAKFNSNSENWVYDLSGIRKFTPKECFRLMGVKDEDFEKLSKNQSNSSLYHLAGDSIVVDVLMALFGEMLDVDFKEHLGEK